MSVGAPCSPCAPPGRSRKRTYCARAASTTCTAVGYPTEASRRLGAPVDTDGALTACSPRRQPRSRTSSDGRRNQLTAVQRRPLSLRSPAMRPTSAESFGSEADGMPRTHGPWPSIAASPTAARSRVRQVACLVRRPAGCRPGPCTADPRHPYPVHAPLPPCNYSLEQVHRRPTTPPATGTLSDEHERGIHSALGLEASPGLLCWQCTP